MDFKHATSQGCDLCERERGEEKRWNAGLPWLTDEAGKPKRDTGRQVHSWDRGKAKRTGVECNAIPLDNSNHLSPVMCSVCCIKEGGGGLAGWLLPLKSEKQQKIGRFPLSNFYQGIDPLMRNREGEVLREGWQREKGGKDRKERKWIEVQGAEGVMKFKSNTVTQMHDWCRVLYRLWRAFTMFT